MDCTDHFRALLLGEDQAARQGDAERSSSAAAADTTSRYGTLHAVHKQCIEALSRLKSLESRSSGLRTDKQLDPAAVDRLITGAERSLKQVDCSHLRDDQRAYYSGVVSNIEQRLQSASIKIKQKTRTIHTAATPATALISLVSPGSVNTVPPLSVDVGGGADTLLMEKTLYSAFAVVDRSQQESSRAVTQTLNEVQQLYKQMAATVYHDGERILHINDTIDHADEFINTANDFVQRTYVLSKRYHKYIALTLLIILIWLIIRWALRRM